MHIHGVEVKEKESRDDVMNTLKKYYSSLNVQFDPDNIERAHCIVLLYTDNHSGEIVKTITVKSTIIHKIFETNSSFHVKYHTTGNVQFLFFRRFLLVQTKFSFREEDSALGNNSMKFRDFPDIS